MSALNNLSVLCCLPILSAGLGQPVAACRYSDAAGRDAVSEQFAVPYHAAPSGKLIGIENPAHLPFQSSVGADV